MTIRRSFLAIFTIKLLLVLIAVPSYAKQAPDFPPGTFSDGNQYSLERLRGQIVVLFFYEQNCPSCARKIPDRNKVVEQFADKPVTFIAIAAGDSADEASAYVDRTGLVMPVFADKLSLMEKLYGTKISLRNIAQFRVIDPEGNTVGYTMDTNTINKALAKVKQSYNPTNYHEKLAPIVKLLNKGNYSEAMRGLGSLTSSRDETVKASAEALNTAVIQESKDWVEQANGLVESDPVYAHSLYSKALKLFPREAFAKDARKKLATLRSHSKIKDESAAQKMYVKMIKAIDKMKPEQASELVAYANKIAEKYPDTPTGMRCAALAERLGR